MNMEREDCIHFDWRMEEMPAGIDGSRGPGKIIKKPVCEVSEMMVGGCPPNCESYEFTTKPSTNSTT